MIGGIRMIVENTERNREIKRAVASMSIEDMYFDKSFLSEIIKVSNGEKTSEDLRKELLKKYARY